MKYPLYKTIEKSYGANGVDASLKKHLSAVGINDWDDINKESLYDFRDELLDTVATSSAKTLMAFFKSLLNRYSESLDLPKNFTRILTVRATKPMKIYLTEEDLKKVEEAPVHTIRQRWVKSVFIICAYTGLRVSDATALTPQNISGKNLRFVAKKTKKAGVVPLKPGLDRLIRWISEHKDVSVTLAGFNTAIRKICKDAGINDEVVVLKGGKEQRGPKWKFVSSHTARISTASCLSRRGVPIADICKLLQHSNMAMTERYIIRDGLDLSENAMAYFR